jgi:hypothetical protein
MPAIESRPFADILNAACADPKRLLGGDPADFGQKKNLAARLREKLRASRKFYVDEEVARAAMRLGVQHPNILLEMLRRARPPFETIWLDWPLRPQIEESGTPYYADAPERSACFIDRLQDDEFRLTLMGGPPKDDPTNNQVAVNNLAIVYNVRIPIARPDLDNLQITIAGISKLSPELLKKALIGSGYNDRNNPDADTEENKYRQVYCDQLAAHAAWIINPLLANYQKDVFAGKYDGKRYTHRRRGFDDSVRTVEASAKDALSYMYANDIMEHSGQWRFVVSLLALINAQDHVQHEDYRYGKTRSQIVGGHIVPYLEHILVKLKLPRQVVETRMVADLVDAIPRRRHEVIGHFRQSRKRGDANCAHAYFDVTPTRQRCALCNHSIWWVDEFERGDARLGYVIKDRLVTKS